MKKLLLLCMIMGAVSVSAQTPQDCDCESNFEWAKKTFEENDAGFQYVIEQKGQAAYDIHNQIFREKIKSAQTVMDCTKLIYEWMKFFRSGHMGVRLNEEYQTGGNQSETTVPINYESVDINIDEFKKYISNKPDTDYEGLWESAPYKVGIKKEGDSYIGFITETEVDNWKPGQLKIKITEDDKQTKVIYYMRDHSVQEYDNITKLDDNHFITNGMLFERLEPKQPSEQWVLNYIKLLNTNQPYLDKINEKTLYLRIPRFDFQQKAAIDKVINDNRDLILRTENLIIDVRNNGGGSDMSFTQILPFLYTNPVRTVGVEYFSTELTRNYIKELADNPDNGYDEATRLWAKLLHEKLSAHPGEFVNLTNSKVRVHTPQKIYEYPKNVGIIINGANASTTEQFLLAAKQSKKVKLFGHTTFGALDISNLNFVESPCKQFSFIYGMTRSMRIPGMTIDEKGIQPDYYLDEEIPEHKWVEYVNDILNQ